MAASRNTPTRYDSSAGELSSPPSGSLLSDTGSPSRQAGNLASGRARMDADEIVVSDGQRQHHPGTLPVPAPLGAPGVQEREWGMATEPKLPRNVMERDGKRYGHVDGVWVQLTAAGVPRKKPGRKPGSVMKPRNPDDQNKARKPRKPRDPDAPPLQRKRKLAPATDSDGGSLPGAGMPVQPPSPHVATAGPSSGSPSQHHLHPAGGMTPPPHHQRQSSSEQHQYSPGFVRREGYPSSMKNILNADPPSANRPPSGGLSAPARTSGQSYDPIRGNYDPVRETMMSHATYSSTSNSPRAVSQMVNRSPSIASMMGPQNPPAGSPTHSDHGYQPASLPPSPSHPPRTASTPNPPSQANGQESKRSSLAHALQKVVVKDSNFTTIANGPVKKVSPKQKPQTGVSTPKLDSLDDIPQEGEGRSILDFGKARPGEETQVPTIILNIPIHTGETNKYVNFMRMAEDRYGWDALHPRLAANRDRKARIAAAAASLEKVDSGRESGDEMSDDLSEAEASNQENGGTSGPDAQAKPKKKRNFKEDQYDVDDDFVDDSELLWEAQAAASRDGFFVYSGPLVPEEEKPPAGRDPPKRGRGRGSRGGRGSTRGTGTGRGGGPGSRGGSITRKPRITKSEKLQREREKAERESMAQLNSTPRSGYVLQPTTPSLAVS